MTPARKVISLYVLLTTFNLAAWIWAIAVFRGLPLLVGTALLAYSFGLRHAVDADHIAAIDNVTRKLMQQGERPVSVGLWFSLGHSTIVVVGAIAIAGAVLTLQHHMTVLASWGAVIGTLASALFLLAIAAVNWIVFRSVWRAFQQVRQGRPYAEADGDLLMGNRGFLARLFRPLFGFVSSSRRMYFLGLLFGLGFDTATEVGLLGLSAVEAAQGLSLAAVIVLPILFAAGMALIDSTDNVLMLGAYGWAFDKPIRKLYYNLTITGVSVLIALAVGGVEALGLLATRLHLTGPFWALVAAVNDHFGTLGYAIIAVFVLAWLVSFAIYKWRRFDQLEPGVSPSPN